LVFIFVLTGSRRFFYLCLRYETPCRNVECDATCNKIQGPQNAREIMNFSTKLEHASICFYPFVRSTQLFIAIFVENMLSHSFHSARFDVLPMLQPGADLIIIKI